jgi:hypothetical protein
MSALSALFSPFAIIIRLRSAIPSCPSCKRSPVFPPVWVFPSRCDCPSVLFVRLSLSLALRTNGRCNSNPRVLESNQTRNSIFVQLAYSLYGIRSTYLAARVALAPWKVKRERVRFRLLFSRIPSDVLKFVADKWCDLSHVGMLFIAIYVIAHDASRRSREQMSE